MGEVFLVGLLETTSLDQGDALDCTDGRLNEVIAAPEPLCKITGVSLPAWHIDNRHTPCQIEAGHLLIARGHVLRQMTEVLGDSLREVVEPFTSDGGACGHGRTHERTPWSLACRHWRAGRYRQDLGGTTLPSRSGHQKK